MIDENVMTEKQVLGTYSTNTREQKETDSDDESIITRDRAVILYTMT